MNGGSWVGVTVGCGVLVAEILIIEEQAEINTRKQRRKRNLIHFINGFLNNNN